MLSSLTLILMMTMLKGSEENAWAWNIEEGNSGKLLMVRLPTPLVVSVGTADESSCSIKGLSLRNISEL